MNSMQTISSDSKTAQITISLGVLGIILVALTALHWVNVIDLAIPFHRTIVTMLLMSASLEPFIYLYQPKSLYLLGVSSTLLFGFWYFITSLLFIG